MLEHPNEIREFHSPLKGHHSNAATPFKSVDGICQMFDGWGLANTFPPQKKNRPMFLTTQQTPGKQHVHILTYRPKIN